MWIINSQKKIKKTDRDSKEKYYKNIQKAQPKNKNRLKLPIR